MFLLGKINDFYEEPCAGKLQARFCEGEQWHFGAMEAFYSTKNAGL
jgi:hypothetical protein